MGAGSLPPRTPFWCGLWRGVAKAPWSLSSRGPSRTGEDIAPGWMHFGEGRGLSQRRGGASGKAGRSPGRGGQGQHPGGIPQLCPRCPLPPDSEVAAVGDEQVLPELGKPQSISDSPLRKHKCSSQLALRGAWERHQEKKPEEREASAHPPTPSLAGPHLCTQEREPLPSFQGAGQDGKTTRSSQAGLCMRLAALEGHPDTVDFSCRK